MQKSWPNKSLVRTQTTLRFVCAAQLQRYNTIPQATPLAHAH